MKLNLALMAAAALSLTGCVTYDEGYRTTGRVGDGYGTYRGERVYEEPRSRVVEDRAGNVFRVYPDGTMVLIGRSTSSAYPYGYGGYSTYPYGYGGYGGYGSYGNAPYGYGGYSTYPGAYVGPPRVVSPGPVYTPTRPHTPTRPQTNTPPPPPVVMGPVPPPAFTPRTEAPAARAERAEARRESHKNPELRPTEP